MTIVAPSTLHLRHWPFMALKHLLVLLVSAPLALSQGGGLPAKESFSYNIEWRLFNAGKAKVDVTSSTDPKTTDPKTTEPKTEYQIKLHLESTGFVSKLFTLLSRSAKLPSISSTVKGSFF